MKGFKVFIGCIPGDSDVQELTDLLLQHARIKEVNLSTDRNQQNREFCKGFGFVVCATIDDVNKLLDLSNKISYKGRFITLRKFMVGSRLKDDKSRFNKRRIFVGNVPSKTPVDEVKKLFEKYGEIENIYYVQETFGQ